MAVALAPMTFETPSWHLLLVVCAAAAILLEAVELVGYVLRRWPRGRAVGVGALLLLGGPLVALAAAGRLLARQGDPHRLRGWLLAGLRGSPVSIFALLTAFWLGVGALASLVGAALLWSVRSYRRGGGPWRRRAPALAMRLGAITILGLWALRPVILMQQEQTRRGAVLLAVDASASMVRQDVLSGGAMAPMSRAQRFESLRQALVNQRRSLEDLSRDADVELFSFATAGNQPVNVASDDAWKNLAQLKPDGTGTAIGDALARAFDPLASAGRRVLGIVLLSDGCNNMNQTIAPAKFAALMGLRDVPVHTVLVGSERPTADLRALSMRDLEAPEQMDAFSRMTATARIEATGLQGKTVSVTYRFGEVIVGSQTLEVDGQQQSFPVEFSHIPLATGFHRLSIEAACPSVPADQLKGQHSAGALVHVVDRHIRVLYVRTLHPEGKFIVQALVAAERFVVTSSMPNAPAAQQPNGLGQTLEEFLPYHAIIIQGVGADRFTPQQIEIIRELVTKYGKGLAVIGSGQDFAPGWEKTALADLLPVDVGASRGRITQPIQVQPTPEGSQSGVMSLAMETDQPIDWSRLPPLDGANVLEGLSAAAMVLARDAGGRPLIVAQQVGAGRSLAIGIDSTGTRWVLSEDDVAREAQQRFWRQVVLYLAAPKGNIWITTDQSVYQRELLARGAEVVEISAGMEDAQGRPVAGEIQAVLIVPNGQQSKVPLRQEGDLRRGQLSQLRDEGLYTLRVSAPDGKGGLMAANHRFEVVAQDLEAMEVLANGQLMRDMASASKGIYVPLAQLDYLLGELARQVQPEVRRVQQRNDLSVTFRWPVIVAIIALLSAEWVLRKRQGLV